MFRPLEVVFAARKQKFFRPGWFTDLCFFLGQYLLWGGLVLWLLLRFGRLLRIRLLLVLRRARNRAERDWDRKRSSSVKFNGTRKSAKRPTLMTRRSGPDSCRRKPAVRSTG